MLLQNWVITDSLMLVVWFDARSSNLLCAEHAVPKPEDPVILLASDTCHGVFSKRWAGCFQPAGSAVPLAGDITKTAIKILWPSFSTAVFVSALAEAGMFLRIAFMSLPNQRRLLENETKRNQGGREMILRQRDSACSLHRVEQHTRTRL